MTATAAAATDEQILALLADEAGHERGFRLLMQATQERLYWHVRRMVGAHDDADDVLQNTFIKAWRGLPNFKGESRLSTWLYRIATNEAITFLGQKGRQKASSLDDPGSAMAARLRADPWWNGDEAQLQLAAAIAGLPEKQRIVFNLRYYDEMPYEEMSDITGTSVGALKASFHHAVKKVEAHFKNLDLI